MASTNVSFSEDLTCSICLTLFTEPVTLLCGHAFCRGCIRESLDLCPTCPHCRAPVDTRGLHLLSSHVLQNLTEKTRAAGKRKREDGHDKQIGPWTCPEHDEKFKLFCVTDQQLVCLICRDSQKHSQHKFKPVSEAAALRKNELKILAQNVTRDANALETLAQTQKEAVMKTERRAQELKTLIRDKFKEMYQFLNKREEALSDLVTGAEEEGVQRMTKSLREMEEAIAENEKIKTTVMSALEIHHPERFLETWTEGEELKAAVGSIRPQRQNFQVEKTELSLGPYESHLQMFIWKEMIQVVEPREEHLLLQMHHTGLAVSRDQSSALVCNYKHGETRTNAKVRKRHIPLLSNATRSIDQLGRQHYWEVYTGLQSDWELGIPQCVLKKFNGKYHICTLGQASALKPESKLRRLGLYLNCPKKELSFYDADTMAHIHTANLEGTTFPVSAYFKLGSGISHNPLTICRY